jgi:hypothetical protein
MAQMETQLQSIFEEVVVSAARGGERETAALGTRPGRPPPPPRDPLF